MTDKEMWEQDIEFMAKLREENEVLKSKINEAIKFVEKFYKLETTNDLHLMNKIDQTVLLDILKD